MAHPQYKTYEDRFLDAVATELGLVDESALFFKARVCRQFSDKYATNTRLVEDVNFLQAVFLDRYREDDRKWLAGQADTKLKETLRRKIKPIIEANQWTVKGREIRGWKDLIEFLRNDYFEKWWQKNRELLESDRDGWEQLWNRVTCWDGIKIKTSKIPTLEFDASAWEGETEDVPSFSWDEALRYEVRSNQIGYLTLIQKYASGSFYLFAPSLLVKQPIQPAREHRFPSERLPYLPLKAGSIGEERIVAIISETKPDFCWLEADNQKPKELQDRDLQEVLRFIRREGNCEVIGARFRIVPPS